MKINWKAWIRQLSYWTVMDQETNCYIIFSKDAKDRNFSSDDIGYANPLGQIYHNMTFYDFKMARDLIKYVNYMENTDRYQIEYCK